jgi:hypothetical protein
MIVVLIEQRTKSQSVLCLVYGEASRVEFDLKKAGQAVMGWRVCLYPPHTPLLGWLYEYVIFGKMRMHVFN